MVPGMYMAVPAIPISANGKMQRASLPPPVESVVAARVASRSLPVFVEADKLVGGAQTCAMASEYKVSKSVVPKPVPWPVLSLDSHPDANWLIEGYPAV